MIKVSVGGSAMVAADIDLDDDVVVVVTGRCSAKTETSTPHQGHVDGRRVTIEDLVVLTGREAVEFEHRIRSEAADRDATVVEAVLDNEPGDVPELA